MLMKNECFSDYTGGYVCGGDEDSHYSDEAI